MARRKKRARSRSGALLLLALALSAAVVWAILPRRASTPRVHHRVSPSAPVALAPAQSAIPAASPQQTPQLSPAPSPAITVTTVPSTPAAARVAIIIDDCGQWPSIERGYVALPIPLTLSVLPHVAYSRDIAQEASHAGKGVMLHLPMEPISHRNPGPGAIDVAMTDADIARQTEDDIAQVPLATGGNNHEGSAASTDSRVMKAVLEVFKAHNLFFIDSRTNPLSVGEQQAHEEGVPTAARNVFLDNRADVAYSESMLEETARIALREGSAIAIGHPKTTTLAALREMYPKLQAEGVQFVFASQLVR